MLFHSIYIRSSSRLFIRSLFPPRLRNCMRALNYKWRRLYKKWLEFLCIFQFFPCTVTVDSINGFLTFANRIRQEEHIHSIAQNDKIACRCITSLQTAIKVQLKYFFNYHHCYHLFCVRQFFFSSAFCCNWNLCFYSPTESGFEIFFAFLDQCDLLVQWTACFYSFCTNCWYQRVTNYN